MTRIPLSVVQLHAQQSFPQPVFTTAKLEAGPRVRLSLLSGEQLVEVVVVGDGTPDDVRWLNREDCQKLVPAPEAVADDVLPAECPPAPPRRRSPAKPATS